MQIQPWRAGYAIDKIINSGEKFIRASAMLSMPTARTGKKKPRSRRRLTPDARRSELLEYALDVFAKRGIGEARHTEIATAAAVSVATVFVYFPTRDALVDAVLDEVARFLTGMAEAVHSSNAAADAVLLEHIRAFSESVETSPAHARIWLDWSTAVRDEIWERYLEFIERILAIVAATLARGQRDGVISNTSAPRDQARLLVGSAHMIALMKISGSPADQLDHFIATLIGAVIGKPGRAPAAMSGKRTAKSASRRSSRKAAK